MGLTASSNLPGPSRAQPRACLPLDRTERHGFPQVVSTMKKRELVDELHSYEPNTRPEWTLAELREL
eukprot:6280420-Alexandrium_andersonii.AAC.1